jgi:hypothetical protein
MPLQYPLISSRKAGETSFWGVGLEYADSPLYACRTCRDVDGTLGLNLAGCHIRDKPLKEEVIDMRSRTRLVLT